MLCQLESFLYAEGVTPRSPELTRSGYPGLGDLNSHSTLKELRHGMAWREDGATPLGLNTVMNTSTPGSRCGGNPGLTGVMPSAYLL